MARPIVPLIPTEAQKTPCTQTYTWGEVWQHISHLKTSGKTLRQIAKEDYEGRVSHAVIQRVLDGHEPKDPKIREALCLPAYHQVVVIMPGGDVPPGTQVISASFCECGQPFISNHPARKKCFICSPYRKRNRLG